MKVKIFKSDNFVEMEKEINDWLEINKIPFGNCKILQSQSQRWDDYYLFIVTIFYI